MNDPSRTSIEIVKLIDRFRNAALEKGDFAYGKEEAQLFDTMRESYHCLRDFGETGREALAQLLDDESVHVRCWVATALLVEGDARARSVLEAIVKNRQ